MFSAALHPSSEIGEFVMLAGLRNIKFYAPDYLRVEINRHFPKFLLLSGLSEPEALRVIELVYEKIQFIPDDEVPIPYWARAMELVREVDEDDVVFVALTDLLQETLWTGDTKLYRLLIGKGYQTVINFGELKDRYPEML